MRPKKGPAPGNWGDLVQAWIFTLVVTCIGRSLLAADRILGRIRPGTLVQASGTSIRRELIPSGGNLLDAVVVRPASTPERAALLICHGIGEIVEHWTAAQRLLATYGISSLVFDYSGYGRSTGFVNATQCERDAVFAFQHLQTLVPSLPISILGFSMGSGVAAGLVRKLPLHRLVLCAAFTSFKEAADAVRWPRVLSFMVPDLWRTRDALIESGIPTLIVHGAKDQLFPSQMALELRDSCGPQAELIVVPGLSHGDPFYHPQPSYWAPVAAFVLRDRRPVLPPSPPPRG